MQSRLLGAWWTRVLGLGRTSYEQRLPNLAWSLPAAEKWALLSGLWEGDGSWSLINGGPSVVLEARHGVRRVGRWRAAPARRPRRGRLAPRRSCSPLDEGHVLDPRRRRGPGRASDRARPRARPARCPCLASPQQRKRIAPTGFRRGDDGPSWVRIREIREQHHVWHVCSLEVPLSHTVVTSGGVTTSNCFPEGRRSGAEASSPATPATTFSF